MALIETLKDYTDQAGLVCRGEEVSPFSQRVHLQAQHHADFRNFGFRSAVDETGKTAVKLYGEEFMRLKTAASAKPGQLPPEVNKVDVIRDLTRFFCEQASHIPTLQRGIFFSELHMAAMRADSASFKLGDVEIPDPRFKTCFAVAEAFRLIALRRPGGDDVSRALALTAIHCLLSLGVENSTRISLGRGLDADLQSQDTTVIGYKYLKTLIDLSVRGHTRELVAEVLGQSSGLGVETNRYIATLITCVRSYADTMHVGPSAHATFCRYHSAFKGDVRMATLLMVDGLKAAQTSSFDELFISEFLPGLMMSQEVGALAPQLVKWADLRVRNGIDKPHATLHGQHLALAAGPIIGAMYRTIDPKHLMGPNRPYMPTPKPSA